MDLLQTWKQWAESAPALTQPQILLADAATLRRIGEHPGVTHWKSWEDCARNMRPWDSGLPPLHVGLVPLPFVGDVRHARLFFLLLNPGLSATDYFAEYKVPEFRKRLLANLRQDFTGTEYPFFPLDPEFAWHSGATYWEKKLKFIVKALCELAQAPEELVRKVVAQNVCAVEQVPYHSRSFALREEVVEELASARMARDFVRNLQKTGAPGERLFVVMRRVKGWGLSPDADNVFCFTGGEARAAHLGVADETAAGTRAASMLLPLVREHMRGPGK